ncbi:MAG: DUF2800 domain-containing protein [Pseudomonadota bacterium]
MAAHAKWFRPSMAAQIIDCAASLRHTNHLPDTTRIDAAWGSVAHELTERVCTLGGVASMHVGEVIEHDGFQITVDDEMAEAVTRCVALAALTPGEHYIETRVDISRWCPPTDPEGKPLEAQFGTTDFAACAPGWLRMKDWKFGKGVQVYAERNPQMALYALGFLNEWDWLYDFQKIEIEIVQPRLDWIDTWIVSKADLLAFGEYIKEKFTLAMLPDAPFGPTEKACKFCKLNGTCRAQQDHLNAITALAFDDIEGEFEYDPNVLTDPELVQAWRLRGLYNGRIKEIERILIGKMMRDEPLPGLKTVEGKTRRKWKSEDEARAFLTNKMQLDIDAIAPRKLVSPAQIEKRMPLPVKMQLEQFWMKPTGRPTLADAKDKRPAYKPASLDAFDKEDESDADD